MNTALGTFWPSRETLVVICRSPAAVLITPGVRVVPPSAVPPTVGDVRPTQSLYAARRPACAAAVLTAPGGRGVPRSAVPTRLGAVPPTRSLSAERRLPWAAEGVGSGAWMAPYTVGPPVIEAVGDVPRSPNTTVGPLLVTPAP